MKKTFEVEAKVYSIVLKSINDGSMFISSCAAFCLDEALCKSKEAASMQNSGVYWKLFLFDVITMAEIEKSLAIPRSESDWMTRRKDIVKDFVQDKQKNSTNIKKKEEVSEKNALMKMIVDRNSKSLYDSNLKMFDKNERKYLTDHLNKKR